MRLKSLILFTLVAASAISMENQTGDFADSLAYTKSGSMEAPGDLGPLTLTLKPGTGTLNLVRSPDQFFRYTASGEPLAQKNLRFQYSEREREIFFMDDNLTDPYAEANTQFPLPLYRRLAPTVVTLQIPADVPLLAINLLSRGTAEVIADGISGCLLNATVCDASYVQFHSASFPQLQFVSKDKGQLVFGCDKSRTLNSVDLRASNEGRITVEGVESTCDGPLYIKAKDDSGIAVSGLFVSQKSQACIRGQGNSSIRFLYGGLEYFDLKGKASAKIVYEQGASFGLRRHVYHENSISSVGITGDAKVRIFGRVDKLDITASDSAEFLFKSTYPLEAVRVTAKKRARVEFAASLKRANFVAKKQAHISANEVTDVLDEEKSSGATVEVAQRPKKVEFTF